MAKTEDRDEQTVDGDANEEELSVRIVVRRDEKDDAPVFVRIKANSDQTGVVVEFPPDLSIGDAIEQSAAEAAKSAPADNASPIDERLKLLSDRMIVALQQRGLVAEQIANADFTIEATIDFSTGQIFARHKELHSFTKPPPEAINLASNFRTNFLEVLSKHGKIKDTITEQAAAGNHTEAARLGLSNEAHHAIMFGHSKDILDALVAIDVEAVDPALKKDLLLFLAALASKESRYDIAGPVSEDLLDGDFELEPEIRKSLKNGAAVAALHKGEKEYAISVWKELLADPTGLEAGERGWIWRNLSMAHDEGSVFAIQAAENSIDAFLEAGHKNDALQSIARLSDLQERSSPRDAINQYDRMMEIISQRGAFVDEIKANVLHRKARKLIDMTMSREALPIAQEAVELRRGIAGAEEHMIASLHLASIAATNFDEEDLAIELRNEAADLAKSIKSVHFDFAERVSALMRNFNAADAAALVAEADRSGDPEWIVWAGATAIISNPDLPPKAKLRGFEAVLQKLRKVDAKEEVMFPVKLAIGQCLRDLGEYRRAYPWYEQLVEANPLDMLAFDTLIDTLWKCDEWGLAANHLHDSINKFGAAPNRLYAYGRSLFEAGNMNGAIGALTKCIASPEAEDGVKTLARDMRDKAYDLGGTVAPAAPLPPKTGPVGLSEVTSAIQEFSAFVSSAKRMEFWQKSKETNKHEWITRPESRGQTLFHTYMQAKFGTRTEVFEEIDAGAGRLDVLLRFEGGLSVIVELKMCGAGYTTTYARSGEGQVRHYMQNRGIHTGYLVVFDGRSRDAGNPILDQSDTGSDTVMEVIVNISPVVSI
ncbi:hypothetical protein SAMN05216360_12548 [Methylobacterium phyllostachyos]|uniref:Uncharacterized protein n=1 Tax=Methylobacterium phyllostachyos TaxID=582672 RepID=A0A1H0K9C3_9HYPH|nr:hypothetical protein [Methylobacterium phyllostachyos]SDO52403.1 hypothetical protein SAMN05216360_12548 [Methylobacterium phyllostachyos]